MDPDFSPDKICPENVCHNDNDLPVLSPVVDGGASGELGFDTASDGRGGGLPPTALVTLIPRREGPRYLLQLRQYAEQHALGRLCLQYLATEVHGIQSDNTLEAKTRDLLGFTRWFVDFNGHGDPGQWLPRDTQAYLRHLEALPRAPTTVNRVLASLHRFARWAHELPGQVFALGGIPTRGVRGLTVSESDCKKLSRRQCHALLKAADTLIATQTHARSRPRRTRALFALLYHTGLRVHELVGLRRDQYEGGYLLNVARKGKARSRGVYVPTACRRLVDDYLEHEWPRDAGAGAGDRGAGTLPLFLASGSPLPMARQHVCRALAYLAREASTHREAPIRLSPHMLRHTFGAEYRDSTGSDTETAAALGHAGLQHVGQYVRRSDAEREAIVEGMFD